MFKRKDYNQIYKYINAFNEIITRKTSLKLYLSHFYKLKFKEGEVIYWKGKRTIIPKVLYFPPNIDCEFLYPLAGQYWIPECHVGPGDIVFDIGAHFGFFTNHALQNGASEIFSFEPNPYIFEILQEHAKIWDARIKPIQLAISNSAKELPLFLPEGKTYTGWATLKNSKEGDFKKIIVRATTIDNFVLENNIKKVDFIKIDTEGNEKEILDGARETIKKFKPRMAISAYHLPNDKETIPRLVLSLRNDYKYKLVCKGEENLFFY